MAEPTDASLIASLRGLDRDGRWLSALRTIRMFGYGSLAVVLVLHLAASGLDPLAIGAVLTLTLVGDTIVSLWLTTHADRLGRRRVLIAGSLLVVTARRRTATFAWYNVAGYVATATGALIAGLLSQALISAGWHEVDAYRAVV